MTKKLPIRNQNQNLEELSKRYFENCLPSDWIAFKRPNDFGVDLHVDIFKDNRATGLEFLVQLKSSERKSNNQNESVILKVSTFNYLKGKLQPVLLVKYSIEENEAYWIWLKDIPSPNQNNKSFTIRIPKINKLGHIDWNSIYQYVNQITDEKLAKISSLEQEARHLNSDLKEIDYDEKKSIKQIVEEKTRLINFKKNQELFFNSEDGVRRSEEEVDSLFNSINTIINDIHNPDSGLLFKTESKHEACSKILEICANNLILRIEWFCRFKNTLNSSGIGFWLTKGFRHFDDYGEKGDTIHHNIYFTNIDEDNNVGWSKEREDLEIISSEELADIWLGHLINNM